MPQMAHGQRDDRLLPSLLRRVEDLHSELGYLSRLAEPAGTPRPESTLKKRAAQRAAWITFAYVRSFGGFLMARDIPSRRELFLRHAEVVGSAIAQDEEQWHLPKGASNRFTDALAALASMTQLLRDLPHNGHSMRVVVPDTNVLVNLAQRGRGSQEGLLGPLREEWWSILVVVVPQVVRELDRMKAAYRRTPLSEAAQDVIRRLNEIRQLERTMPAIPVEEQVQVDFLLTEPDKEDWARFPWLDASLPDHRIIISTLDAARRWPHDEVVLMTNDLHMALLASYAGISTSAP